MKKLGFIGGGNMAEALAHGLIVHKVFKPGDLIASDVAAARRTYLKRKLKISVTADNLEVIKHSRAILFAVKPQTIDDVLESIAGALGPNPKHHLFISIAAGVPIARRTIESYLLRQTCSQNLHKIAVALQNYHDEHGVYPPAIAYDGRGVPKHSWRVLILPQLGKDEEELYKRYRLDEPWDGPNNRPLADEMPRVYACPVDPGAMGSGASYLALVNAANGQFAAQPPAPTAATPNPTAPVDKLVIEVAESGIIWTEPRDVSLGQAAGSAGTTSLPARFSYHAEGSHLVDTDGESVLLTNDQVHAALEPADQAVAEANEPSDG